MYRIEIIELELHYYLFQESWHTHKSIISNKDKNLAEYSTDCLRSGIKFIGKLGIMDRERPRVMVVAEKGHPRCIRDTSAEPQNTDSRPSHILALGP